MKELGYEEALMDYKKKCVLFHVNRSFYLKEVLCIYVFSFIHSGAAVIFILSVKSPRLIHYPLEKRTYEGKYLLLHISLYIRHDPWFTKIISLNDSLVV